MASVFPRYDRRPIPEGAEITTRRKEKVVRFKDERGRTQIHPLSEDGACMLVKRNTWYIAFKDAAGKRQTVKGYSDREASEQKGRELERQAARAKEGLPSADREKRQTPIKDVLALYLEDLQRRGRGEDHLLSSRVLIERLVRECQWSTMASIRPKALISWLAAAKRAGKAPRTLNAYLEAARRFVDWSLHDHYLEGNPLASIERAGQKGEEQRVRRALTINQLAALLEVSPTRRLVYLTAMLTGLRRKELRKLLWVDVFLDGDRPHIWLRSCSTKSKRDDTIPLPPELVEALRAAKPTDVTPDTKVFRTVPAMATYKRDLEKAGIEYKDVRDRQADFHALRMSYNMLLANQDVPIRVAKELMRHSKIELTAKVYNDPAIYDLHAAVETLPRIAGAGSIAAKSADRKASAG
jgi:integrase